MVPKWGQFLRGRAAPKIMDASIDKSRLPKHVAIIMDGNGRWARSRGLPRAAGHHAGMVAMREVIRAADDVGIEAITLYAFSTENWKRPIAEVQYLWTLLEEFFKSDIDELVERNVRIVFIGNTNQLPDYTQGIVKRAIDLTRPNTGMVVQFALNYGSRAELVQAVRSIAEKVSRGEVDASCIDEHVIASELQTCGVPDPDLLIRTSGDQRISNFLLWQIAYTELYFAPEMWPDFKRNHFLEAIRVYSSRERRFGGLK